jgi:23S rRNA (pseudouridine1915-N3)-methyltransferase
MQLTVIAVGKLKERYWQEALAEYAKRLSGYARIEVLEVQDEPAPENVSEATKQQILRLEAAKVEKLLRDRDAVIALDISGTQLSSEAWSSQYQRLEGGGYGRLVFVMGGSFGLSDQILQRAVYRWSFGPITLPHQLARVVLVEQIYRGIRIAKGEPYHK